jgi:hypothetical protein
MKNKAKKWTSAFAALAVLSLPGTSLAADSCKAHKSWLTDPSLPTKVADEADNCSFHQFMWQSLFYLVQPSKKDSEVLNFETWMPSYGLFVGPGETPADWGSIAKSGYCKGPAKPKASHVFSNLTKQAGSGQPLIDKAGKPVYYSVSVNKPAYGFITGCDLYKAQCSLTLAPDLLTPTDYNVVDIPVKYPDLEFPEQSIELKLSWKILTSAEKISNTFYTTTGTVQSGSDACSEEVLGLVGIHIVSKTQKHPEFIWATFEHKNNAPVCLSTDAKPPIGGDWTFYNPKCTGSDCDTNEYNPGKPTQVCTMHPWGDPTIGTFPNNLNCDSTPPPGYICDEMTQQYVIKPNTANLKALDKSVSAMLAKLTKGDSNKLWANYTLVGNIWTTGQHLPPDLQIQRGSLSDANNTMETYVQNGEANITNPNSCFSCHNLDGKSLISAPGQASHAVRLPPAGISHIFNLLDLKTKGCSNGKLPGTKACPFTAQTIKK